MDTQPRPATATTETHTHSHMYNFTTMSRTIQLLLTEIRTWREKKITAELNRQLMANLQNKPVHWSLKKRGVVERERRGLGRG